MLLIVGLLAYLAGHFVVYFVGLRHRATFKTERGIFLLHAVSFVLCVAGGSFLGQAAGRAVTGVVLAAGVHGIYSLSFLELWSLTQASYSLNVLNAIAHAGGSVLPAQLDHLVDVGRGKQAARADVLPRLGLARTDGTPTLAGKVADAGLRFVLWLTMGRPFN